MADKMTLIDVRDWHRTRELSFARQQSPQLSDEHKQMADAIEPYLVVQAQSAERVPEGCIAVPRSLVERWANVDAFNAPIGAAMELKVIAGQMLQHADMLAAGPQPGKHERRFVGPGYLEQTGYIDPQPGEPNTEDSRNG